MRERNIGSSGHISTVICRHGLIGTFVEGEVSDLLFWKKKVCLAKEFAALFP